MDVSTGKMPGATVSREEPWPLTRKTETLRSKGLKSGVRMGLVLLLWPGVETLLLVRWELRRCGRGMRTMMVMQQQMESAGGA